MPNGLILAGSLFGAAFAAVLLARGLMERSWLPALAAAALLVPAAASFLIVASWARPAGAGWIAIGELALLIVSGPIVLVLTGRLLQIRVPLAMVGIVAAAAFAGALLLEARLGGDPIRHAVLFQGAFVLWSWLLFVRERRPAAAPGRRRRRQLAFWLLGAVSMVSLASLVRLAFPDASGLGAIVPLTIAALFLALLIWMCWAFLARHWAEWNLARPDAGDEALVGRAHALIADEQLYRDYDLPPAEVAARLGVPAAKLAGAMRASEWGSLAAMVQAIRIDQVRRMLADPSERATSIDAIGMLCGFRSRSALYESFQRQLGMSPGQYRRRSLSLS